MPLLVQQIIFYYVPGCTGELNTGLVSPVGHGRMKPEALPQQECCCGAEGVGRKE